MEGKTEVVLSSRRGLKKMMHFGPVGVSKTKQNGSWPEPTPPNEFWTIETMQIPQIPTFYAGRLWKLQVID